MSKPKVSICVPFHQTDNTAMYLSRLLKTVERQSFRDFEIVLTSEGAFAENHNAAIKKAKGEIVQFLQMDDFFTHKDSLKDIVNAFDKHPYDQWLISASMHYYQGEESNLHIPYWTDDIYTGNNRLGSVSTLAMRRDRALLFEEPLSWVVDVDLYYRLYLKYGLPILTQSPNVSIDTRTDRLSHTIPDADKLQEVNYLIQKYGK